VVAESIGHGALMRAVSGLAGALVQRRAVPKGDEEGAQWRWLPTPVTARPRSDSRRRSAAVASSPRSSPARVRRGGR
jgi:hypothetical protein